jgi:hypothetical protein
MDKRSAAFARAASGYAKIEEDEMNTSQSLQLQSNRNRNRYLPAPPKSLIAISENHPFSSGRYARTLRAIGHALETLEVEVFELSCEGKNYLVRTRPKTIKDKWHQILKYWFPTRFGAVGLLTYTPEDVERLQQEGQAKRKNGGTNPNRLTQALRAIGFYVDLKNSRLIKISRNDEWMKVRYETASGSCNTEEFNLSSLYTLFMQMYVKRRDGRKAAEPN